MLKSITVWCGTRSAVAIAAALAHSKPQANPIVPRGKLRKYKPKKTKMALCYKKTDSTPVSSTVCVIL